MSRRSTNRTAASVAAVTQAALTSSSAEAALDGSGTASEATASSDGASDTTDAGAGGDTNVGGGQASDQALTFPADLDQVHHLGGDMTITRDDLVAATALAVSGSPEAWNALSVEAQADHLANALQAARDQIGAHIAAQDPGAGTNLLGQADLAPEPSPSSAPQVSDQDSAPAEPVETPAEDESLYGSSIQPAFIDLGLDVTVPLGVVVVEAARHFDMPTAEWNDQHEAVREDMIASMIDVLRDEIVWPPKPALIEMVEVISRDDQPYRRCGHVWTATPQVAGVHQLVAERLKADPFLIVRPPTQPVQD